MRLLNKTFFKFVFGFIAILLIGIVGVLATGYYDEVQGDDSSDINTDDLGLDNQFNI